MYKIIKVLNNNTVLAAFENDEVIIMYKGIGFGKKLIKKSKYLKMPKIFDAEKL
ncbi:CAT RNA binding domain-containing protein [Coprobacillaceae bacterium CR2/5/TPMF4]|nr:CAT RNA binding domain-containing protein [Coprobacillaceae bacterium CR2/5/TPMF4]